MNFNPDEKTLAEITAKAERKVTTARLTIRQAEAEIRQAEAARDAAKQAEAAAKKAAIAEAQAASARANAIATARKAELPPTDDIDAEVEAELKAIACETIVKQKTRISERTGKILFVLGCIALSVLLAMCGKSSDDPPNEPKKKEVVESQTRKPSTPKPAPKVKGVSKLDVPWFREALEQEGQVDAYRNRRLLDDGILEAPQTATERLKRHETMPVLEIDETSIVFNDDARLDRLYLGRRVRVTGIVSPTSTKTRIALKVGNKTVYYSRPSANFHPQMLATLANTPLTVEGKLVITVSSQLIWIQD